MKRCPAAINALAPMPESMTLTAPPEATRQHAVSVRASARLHLGFLDPAATLGRRFGSLGLVIDGFETEVEIGPAAVDRCSAANAESERELPRAAAHLATLRQISGHQQALHLRLLQVLPPHAGLGSGTQLALAVGRAFAAWHGLDVPTTTLAMWLGRGQRSGIGVNGFDRGGLLLDGGPGSAGRPAPLLARQPFPDDWRLVVVLDPRQRGLSGADERQALATLPALPQAAAADLCHQVLMRVLPGAAESCFAPFADGVTRLQQVLGQHFAPAQQGSAYASPAVGRLMDWLADWLTGTEHRAALGQSSWGPTAFAIVPSAAAADALMAGARASHRLDPALLLRVVRGRNHGAQMSTRRHAMAPARP